MVGAGGVVLADPAHDGVDVAAHDDRVDQPR